jgi:(E)-4-hydroxy-3-methylbut-2-enyl-diphosphate synthase
VKRTITVSVMGCVVNGPGEGMHADIGIAGGKQKGILYRNGKVVSTLPEGQLLSTLLEELHAIADEDARFIAEGKPLPVGLSEREGVLT